MNLYHLRYFVTLAKLEHYTKAAEELCITQPSLSHAISLLEKELGVTLFQKEGRNIALTKCGKIFLERVQESLKILDDSILELKSISNGEGYIDLGFLRTLGTNFVPKLTKNYIESNKDKKINFNFFTETTTSDLIKSLKEQKYDMIFCSKCEKEKNIEFIPVSTQKLVLIVPSDHPLSEYDSVTLEQTIEYPQIVFSQKSGLRSIIDNLFDTIGKKPIIAYEIEEDQVIAGLVSNNFGIAIVPYMPILKFMNVKTIDISSPTWERNFYLALLKDKTLTPIAENFKSFVIDNYTL
ncbi:MAG: LysR family transcriptional regulator [Intestinibacter sp.]|uniref:LysR family transcriptional regulator n=1 Tax=Intestinibacter sp. TaxID=1965304 RepID=UPI0025C20BE0|nr:LysR family transcriptional regulator [Intestinibacter sp.]MCI6737037.1 LysR family transcriptional regulator [Intestinibacter sp.]